MTFDTNELADSIPTNCMGRLAIVLGRGTPDERDVFAIVPSSPWTPERLKMYQQLIIDQCKGQRIRAASIVIGQTLVGDIEW